MQWSKLSDLVKGLPSKPLLERMAEFREVYELADEQIVYLLGFEAEIAALEGENERYRLALENIGALSTPGELPEIVHAPLWAREALDHTPPEEEG
jgi:hypothetical protein